MKTSNSFKYKYNPNTLSYDKVELSVFDRIFKIASYLVASIVLGVVIIGITSIFYDTPKEKGLKRELAHITIKYDILNERVSSLNNIVLDMQYRDDNIYRVIFETQPLARSVREAGFGGAARYSDLAGYDNSHMIIETTKKIDKLQKQVVIQSKSYDEVFKMALNKADMLASLPAIQPISNKDLSRISSGYGRRIHPIYKTWHLHTGIDFVAPTGTEIYATGKGVVKSIEKVKHGKGRGYGNHIVVDHAYNYKTLYAHLSVISVKPGQKVNRGDIIGYVGNTGTSTAPHLHYEVIKSNNKIDPINYFFNDLTPEEYEKVIELASRANQSFD